LPGTARNLHLSRSDRRIRAVLAAGGPTGQTSVSTVWPRADKQDQQMQDERDARSGVSAAPPAPDARPTIAVGVEVEEPLFLDESLEYLPAGRPPQGGSPFDLFADEETPAGTAPARPAPGRFGSPLRHAQPAPRHDDGRLHVSPRVLVILSIAAGIAAFAAVRAWQILAR
jgi:hypothetical protein